MLYKITIIGLSIFNMFAVCSHAKPQSKESYSKFYRSLKSSQIKNWDTKRLNTPIKKRIMPLEPLAMEFNRKFNIRDGFKDNPKSMKISSEDHEKIANEMMKLPLFVRKFIHKHIIAIYTASNIGGSAMAGNVYDQNSKAQFGFIIIDMNKIKLKANQWATYKENTVFSPIKGYELTMTIEHESQNSRYSTIGFLILHEVGHVFHSVMNLQPPYIHLNWKDEDFASYGFNHPELNRKKRLKDDYYPLYDKVRFYQQEAPFDLEDAEGIYKWLRGTSHPSLYGSVNPLEDFAETFAILIHTRYQKKPYHVTLRKGVKKITLLDHPLKRSNVRKKVRIIESNLDRFR